MNVLSGDFLVEPGSTVEIARGKFRITSIRNDRDGKNIKLTVVQPRLTAEGMDILQSAIDHLSNSGDPAEREFAHGARRRLEREAELSRLAQAKKGGRK